MQNITEKELLESIYSVLKEALIIDIIDKNRDKLGNITEDNIDDYAQILTEEYNSFLNHISADEKVEKSVPKYDLLTWLDYWFGVKGKSSSLIANGVFQDESKKYLEYLNRYRKEKNSFLDTVKSHAQEVASDNKLLEAFINIKPEDKKSLDSYFKGNIQRLSKVDESVGNIATAKKDDATWIKMTEGSLVDYLRKLNDKIKQFSEKLRHEQATAIKEYSLMTLGNAPVATLGGYEDLLDQIIAENKLTYGEVSNPVYVPKVNEIAKQLKESIKDSSASDETKKDLIVTTKDFSKISKAIDKTVSDKTVLQIVINDLKQKMSLLPTIEEQNNFALTNGLQDKENRILQYTSLIGDIEKGNLQGTYWDKYKELESKINNLNAIIRQQKGKPLEIKRELSEKEKERKTDYANQQRLQNLVQRNKGFMYELVTFTNNLITSFLNDNFKIDIKENGEGEDIQKSIEVVSNLDSLDNSNYIENFNPLYSRIPSTTEKMEFLNKKLNDLKLGATKITSNELFKSFGVPIPDFKYSDLFTSQVNAKDIEKINVNDIPGDYLIYIQNKVREYLKDQEQAQKIYTSISEQIVTKINEQINSMNVYYSEIDKYLKSFSWDEYLGFGKEFENTFNKVESNIRSILKNIGRAKGVKRSNAALKSFITNLDESIRNRYNINQDLITNIDNLDNEDTRNEGLDYLKNYTKALRGMGNEEVASKLIKYLQFAIGVYSKPLENAEQQEPIRLFTEAINMVMEEKDINKVMRLLSSYEQLPEFTSLKENQSFSTVFNEIKNVVVNSINNNYGNIKNNTKDISKIIKDFSTIFESMDEEKWQAGIVDQMGLIEKIKLPTDLGANNAVNESMKMLPMIIQSVIGREHKTVVDDVDKYRNLIHPRVFENENLKGEVGTAEPLGSKFNEDMTSKLTDQNTVDKMNIDRDKSMTPEQKAQKVEPRSTKEEIDAKSESYSPGKFLGGEEFRLEKFNNLLNLRKEDVSKSKIPLTAQNYKSLSDSWKSLVKQCSISLKNLTPKEEGQVSEYGPKSNIAYKPIMRSGFSASTNKNKEEMRNYMSSSSPETLQADLIATMNTQLKNTTTELPNIDNRIEGINSQFNSLRSESVV